MSKTYLKTVYYFDELSDDAKENAREWMREFQCDYEWYDTVFYDAKEIAKLLGITIKDIYFSGFSSQGDGACFTGEYSYNIGSMKLIKDYAPVDTELHRIALELSKLQRKHFYQLSANIEHSGHYYHEYCTRIYTYKSDYTGYEYGLSENDSDRLIELLRDYMRWIYKQLRNEYENEMSDEVIDETIRINEYTFNENGKREN